MALVPQVKMRGSEMMGGQVEHNYITYINDSSILSACCVANTVSPSPGLCHLVVTTTSKILLAWLTVLRIMMCTEYLLWAIHWVEYFMCLISLILCDNFMIFKRSSFSHCTSEKT